MIIELSDENVEKLLNGSELTLRKDSSGNIIIEITTYEE